MNDRTQQFSVNRVSSFRSYFRSTEQDTKRILTQSQWAIPKLNVIAGRMDEDTKIPFTIFQSKAQINVTVGDLNSMEVLRFQLELKNSLATICLGERDINRKLCSWDLYRLAQTLAPTDPIAATLKYTPAELYL